MGANLPRTLVTDFESNSAVAAEANDPRVSANAVEWLWGVDSPAAREAFFRAARDKYHRISANGIIGLYMMGDASSIPFLFHLSRSRKAQARAAAAWAMGHLKDPRFVPRLGRMMEDSDALTRRGAYRAMARIRQKMGQMRAGGAVGVQIRDCERRGEAHFIRFVVKKDSRFVRAVDWRQFIAWNGPDLVEELAASLQEGESPYYEIAFQGPPSATHLVKVQVYSALGVGEDTGFEAGLSKA